MAEQIWNRSNFFIHGEVGNRLNGIRETEVYKYSANSLTNWYVTEAGNLKAAKKYRGIGLANDEIVDIIDTRYHFFIVATTREFISFDKVTKNPIARLVHNLPLREYNNVSLFENQIFTSIEHATGYWNNMFSFNEAGAIGTSNYLSTIKSPIKDKKTVRLDVYKVYNHYGEWRVANISSLESPEIINSSDNILLTQSGIWLHRLYRNYKTNVAISEISGYWDGMTFGVLQGFFQEPNKSYVLGENIVGFYGEAWDGAYNGSYFTKITGQGSGNLEYGEILKINDNIIDVAVIQNRLALVRNDIIYFSKTFDYNNFRNGTKDDDGFYIKPSPIRNQQPKLLKLTAENILFVASNKGIYAIGIDTTLTPQNSIGVVKIISDTPATKEIEIINNDLYYLSEDGILYCTQLIYTNAQPQMNNTVVEKYDITKRVKNISVGIIDNRTVLIASTLENKVLVYTSIDVNVFRKFSLEFQGNTKVYGYNKDLMCYKSFYEITENNFRNTEISLNPPALKTSKSGSYLNDYESRIERIAINLLNQDREAVKLVEINGQPLNNLGKNQEDYFSLYKHEGKIPLISGFKLNIETKENDKILEIRGIDTLINISGN